MIKAANLSGPGSFRDCLGCLLGLEFTSRDLVCWQFLEIPKNKNKEVTLGPIRIGENLPVRPSFSENALPLECEQVSS